MKLIFLCDRVNNLKLNHSIQSKFDQQQKVIKQQIRFYLHSMYMNPAPSIFQIDQDQIWVRLMMNQFYILIKQFLIILMKNRSRSLINNTTGDKIIRRQHYMNIFSTNQNPSSIDLVTSKPVGKQQKNKNYVFKNKKNLKNFFKERFQKEDYSIKSKNKLVSPAKILELKKQQSSKQEFTKITLNKSVQIENYPKTPSKDTMIQYFNSKSRQNTRKLVLDDDRYKRIGNSLTTYLTPTSNSIIKRNQTSKKQAYVSVFGDKTIQMKQKMLEITCGNNLSSPKKQNIKSIPKSRPKTHLGFQKITNQEKQQLGILLQKLEGIALQINPHRFDFFKNNLTKEQQQGNNNEQNLSKRKTEDTQIFHSVKSVSEYYKRRNQDMGLKHLKTLEDIQKIDAKFYQQMITHKNSRLWVRNKAIYGNHVCHKQSMSVQLIQDSFDFLKKQKQNKQTNDSLQAMMTITERLNGTIQNDQQIKETMKNISQPKSRKEFMNRFCRMLIETKNRANLYGVKFQNIYEALLKKRKPYQLQGSYALFKLIKSGEVEKVKSFINKNIQYAYQVDHQGRSVLIYAVQNNQPQIVKYITKIGVNVDAMANNGNTALYCAIKKNKYDMIQDILRAGASPWSNKQYDLSSLTFNSENRIKLIIKNARRLHIGRKLHRRHKQRNEFWEKNCAAYIQGYSLINF